LAEFSTWDDAEFPLAYLITFRTYGTWLHGDDRRSVDLRGQNVYGTPLVEPNKQLSKLMIENMSARQPFLLDGPHRGHVKAAIEEVCQFKNYSLKAINVRTNHVHSVVSAACRPEPIATAFKAYATRKLRQNGLIEPGVRVWSRGESTRYLWKEEFVVRALEYVINGQGDDLPDW
jgi:REP element-mobilizing transposase RayT